MALTTVSARDFARDLASAKKAANYGPFIVTDRGRPNYALLKIEDYYKLAGAQRQSLLAVMDAIPGEHFAFEPLRLAGNDLKPVDLGQHERFHDRSHSPATRARPRYAQRGGLRRNQDQVDQSLEGSGLTHPRSATGH